MTTLELRNLTPGTILTNANGTRRIKFIKSFVTKHRMKTVYLYSVLDKNGEHDYNDQKTEMQFARTFTVKVA